ncbi:MAG: hypothetical protein ABR562_07795, partial [Thermoplasmatota archaeon]
LGGVQLLAESERVPPHLREGVLSAAQFLVDSLHGELRFRETLLGDVNRAISFLHEDVVVPELDGASKPATRQRLDLSGFAGLAVECFKAVKWLAVQVQAQRER